MAIAPDFERISNCLSAAFFGRAQIRPARRMQFDRVRGAVQNVYAPTIRLPAGHARGKMVIGVRAAALIFFFVFVLLVVRTRITSVPEMFDKTGTLLVIGQFLEGVALGVRNDQRDFFVQPSFVCAFSLARGFFLGRWTLQRVVLPGGRRGCR